MNLTQKKDQENDKDRYGDFRIYCNVGNTWIFLNEFTDGTDGINILSTGLGNSENTSSFNILKSFNVYLPRNMQSSQYIYDLLQIKAQGYEADGIDIMMGHIINEYSRDKDVVNKFFGGHLKYLRDHGEADDEIGLINTKLDWGDFSIRTRSERSLVTMGLILWSGSRKSLIRPTTDMPRPR